MKKKAYAIIGNPVEHSLSPFLHNYWFKKYKIEGDYSLLQTDENNLDAVVKKIRNNELKGINVTLPYKQKIIRFLDHLVNDAKLTNSVNTILLDDTGTLVGENTDVYGLQAAYLKEIINTENKKALVIGAGGVSPSVIFALQKSKIKNISTIYNPIETKTLKFLKSNGIKTFNGLDMFIYQGQKSFYLWNKINPEIDDKLITMLKAKLL